jgi:hypothetical protein
MIDLDDLRHGTLSVIHDRRLVELAQPDRRRAAPTARALSDDYLGRGGARQSEQLAAPQRSALRQEDIDLIKRQLEAQLADYAAQINAFNAFMDGALARAEEAVRDA